MIGLGLDIWRGVKGVGGGGVPLPAPLTGIDTIMLVGASIEAGIAGNAGAFHAAMLNWCKQNGLTGVTSILSYTYPGSGVDAIYTGWTNTVKPALVARADGGAGVLILTMPAGNDITDLAPYATANTTTLAARKAKLELLDSEMKAQVGADHVVLFDHTFRLYGYPATDCITDESLGSKDFNEQWVDPLALQTKWKTEGRSYGYPYPIAYNWYGVLLIDSTHFGADGIGYAIYAKYWMDVAIAIIKGTAPPVVAKKANPIGDQKPKSGKALLVYRNTAGVVRSSNFPLANARGTKTTEQPYLMPWDGYDPVLGLGARPDLTAHVSQTGLGTGDTSYTIMNDLFRDAFAYTTSQIFVVLEEIINLNPFQNFTYKVLCCRNVAAGQVRMQEFSNDGTTVAGEIDGACVPGNIPRVFEGTGQGDAFGKAKIWIRCKEGNAVGAYASALEINPI